MEGERAAMKIFELVKRNRMLPTDQAKLEEIRFIGPAALSYYRAKLNLMDKIGIAEKQRDATLADGQDAAEMLLDVEVRLGKIYRKIPTSDRKRGTRGVVPQKKAEKIGRPQQRISETEQISKHTKIVEQVKAAARERKDIPTKIAVLSAIKIENLKKEHKGIDPTKNYKIPSIDQFVRKNVFRPINELKLGLGKLANNCKNLSELNQELLTNELDSLMSDIQKIRKEL